MKKNLWSLIGMLTLCLVATEIASAQLINYNRRNNPGAVDGDSGSRYTSRAAATPAARKVATRTERRFDANRDGYLQDDEVKMFLKDVLSQVEDRGRYYIDSEILNQYDANGDGMISQYETRQLKRDVG